MKDIIISMFLISITFFLEEMCVQVFTNVLHEVIHVEDIFGKVDISSVTLSGFSNGKREASPLP